LRHERAELEVTYLVGEFALFVICTESPMSLLFAF
jgi:hypothetical protein